MFAGCCFIIFISGLACCFEASDIPESVQSNDSRKLMEDELFRNIVDISKYLESFENSTLVKSLEVKAEDDVDYEDPNAENEVVENDKENVKQRKKLRRQRKKSHINRVGITYTWGKWEKWSRCTHTCVQIRQRQCIKRVQNAPNVSAEEMTFYPDLMAETSGCQGIMKKYRLCKDDRCTTRSMEEMRNEQCAAFNSIIIRGRFHQWLGYEKEHNECTLFCRAKDSDLVMDMEKLVMDGTPCERPSIYYTHYYRRSAVCVEGICRVSDGE